MHVSMNVVNVDVVKNMVHDEEYDVCFSFSTRDSILMLKTFSISLQSF